MGEHWLGYSRNKESSQISYTFYWLIDWLMCTSMFVWAHRHGIVCILWKQKDCNSSVLRLLLLGVPSTCRCTKFCCVCLLVISWGLGLQTGPCACKASLSLLSYFPHPDFSQCLYGQESVGDFARIVWGLSWKTPSAYYIRWMVLVVPVY